ncbi:hypothetical protein STEG23_029090 [Scotinomys teguina]
MEVERVRNLVSEEGGNEGYHSILAWNRAHVGPEKDGREVREGFLEEASPGMVGRVKVNVSSAVLQFSESQGQKGGTSWSQVSPLRQTLLSLNPVPQSQFVDSHWITELAATVLGQHRTHSAPPSLQPPLPNIATALSCDRLPEALAVYGPEEGAVLQGCGEYLTGYSDIGVGIFMVPTQSISKAPPPPNPVYLPWQVKAVSISTCTEDPTRYSHTWDTPSSWVATSPAQFSVYMDDWSQGDQGEGQDSKEKPHIPLSDRANRIAPPSSGACRQSSPAQGTHDIEAYCKYAHWSAGIAVIMELEQFLG